jgi:hypothetical protein
LRFQNPDIYSDRGKGQHFGNQVAANSVQLRGAYAFDYQVSEDCPATSTSCLSKSEFDSPWRHVRLRTPGLR